MTVDAIQKPTFSVKKCLYPCLYEGFIMNAHLERNQCRYCQINLVNIQLSIPQKPQFASVVNKQSLSSVMKCPVCGYSELGEPDLAKNHTDYNKIAILGHQAPAA